MTYLVMECHPAYVIVLDNQGRMIKAANLGYHEGQVIGEIIAAQMPGASVLLRLVPLAAAACLCLAVLGGGAYGAYRVPYGTVEVSINPDVRMSVSYMDRVAGLEGVNEDGKQLIDQVSYKGRNSEYMTELLVERAMEMGYLSEGGSVYVAASGGSERWKEKRADAIRTGLDTLLKNRMQVEIHVESLNKDGTPAASPHHDAGMPGGTGGDKPAFIGVPPEGIKEGTDGSRGDAGGTDDGSDKGGRDADKGDDKDDAGKDDDDKDDDDKGDDDEDDDDKDDDDKDDDDKDDADKGDADKDDDKDDAGKEDTDNREDDIKKGRDKSGNDKTVIKRSDADGGRDNDADDADGRERDDANHEDSDKDDSDNEDSDGDDDDDSDEDDDKDDDD